MANAMNGGFTRDVDTNALLVTGAVTGGLTDTQLRATPVPVSVPDNTPLTTAAPVSVPSSATVVTLMVSNAARRALFIFNNSTSAVYVKFGSTATAADFTFKMAAGAFYEMPRPLYTGIITGIWVSADGAALVTEGA
ncbi:MAG: hypothetical protein V4636_00325 [Pseudomonadota bacterium]